MKISLLFVVRALADCGYDSIRIRTEAPGISDAEVMRYARRENRIILTCAKDFGELVMKEKLCPAGRNHPLQITP